MPSDSTITTGATWKVATWKAPALAAALAALTLTACGSSARRVIDPGDDGGAKDLSISFQDDGGPNGGPCDDVKNPCGVGQRCLDGQCITDNGTCASDDECENDTYCDCLGGGGGPDGGACMGGICVPWGTPPRGTSDPDCQTQGFLPGQFVAPKLKCSWEGSGVMSSTLIADLDGDKQPEIIAETLNNTIIALHGKDCSVMFEKPFLFSQNEGHLAVADLDGDKKPEIIALGNGSKVTVLDNMGNVLATSATAFLGGTFGSVAIADLDNQAPPEILAPGQALRYVKGNPALTVLWTINPGPLADGLLPLAADIDGDKLPEAIQGHHIYDGITGVEKTPPNLKNNYGSTGAFSAIGDFNGDKLPDLVMVQNFDGPVNVSVHDLAHDKQIFGPYMFGGGRMGAPTVADFDGDGKPEFATAGADAYRVFSLKCTGNKALKPPCDPNEEGVLWRKVTQDKSSGVTGSSVFDFNGDGKAEVVYRDECWLRVYNGPDGKTLFAYPVSSFTALEEPVIADIDGDGHTEIITSADQTSKQCPGTPEADTGALWDKYRSGIYVFQDPMNRWMPSRGLWNQHTYHITNINDDLTVPTVEKNNWLTFNNYRQNVQGTGTKPLDVGDATGGVATGLDPGQADCTAAWTLQANLCNRGSAPISAGMPGAFYASNPRAAKVPAICVTTTSMDLQPGDCETVGCDWKSPPQTSVDLWFRADDDGVGGFPVSKECRGGNDLLVLKGAQCGKIM